MNYIYIICPLSSIIICQIFKIITYIIKNKKLDISVIACSGGMPSSHTTFISSLTFLIGYTEGFDSSIFALALIVTMITSYDAMNVRYECGRHAEILNKEFNLKMKENVGHKFFEVVMGLILGFLVATIYKLTFTI